MMPLTIVVGGVCVHLNGDITTAVIPNFKSFEFSFYKICVDDSMHETKFAVGKSQL